MFLSKNVLKGLAQLVVTNVVGHISLVSCKWVPRLSPHKLGTLIYANKFIKDSIQKCGEAYWSKMDRKKTIGTKTHYLSVIQHFFASVYDL